MKNDHVKQVYYGTNERTILICEVSVNGKLKRNKGVNDRRGPQGTGIWDPCLKTWDDACQRAGIQLKSGYYAVLTNSAGFKGRNYIVEAIVPLYDDLKDIQELSHHINKHQKERAAKGLRADDDPLFTQMCVTIGLLPDLDATRPPGSFDKLLKKVMQGEITNNELIMALILLKEEYEGSDHEEPHAPLGANL